MLRKPPINVGDRFVKIGAFQSAIWVVERIFQLPAEPPHAHLSKEGDLRDSITISIPTLSDPSFFRRA
ncbi:MAG TPA: hypothetical protein VLL76_04160 [Candidatus Omnitrophota bacterium]|nr:hypothetical protein [Candidatus Omnitrophota bacterium]